MRTTEPRGEEDGGDVSWPDCDTNADLLCLGISVGLGYALALVIIAIVLGLIFS